MKKILLTLMLIVGSFLTQAQDYIDIIYYSADGVSYEMIVGEKGFTDGDSQDLGCVPNSLVKGSGIRLLKNENNAAEVIVQLLLASGTVVPLDVTIENTTALNTLLTLSVFDGVATFTKLNSVYIGIQDAVVDGTSITF